MQIVIDIPEEEYKRVMDGKWEGNDLASYIEDGTLLPKGKWIRRHYITRDKTFDMCVCNNCGEEFSYDAETGLSMHQYGYCPNCRAEMESEK